MLGNSVASACLQLGLYTLALLQSLGDDHRLGEKVVGQLDIERQIEPDGALTDIRGPMVHVLIVLQELLQPGRGVLRCVDRSVLRQLQIHEQLGPIGRREELLWNEAHPKERRCEQAERDEDRDPACPHGQHEKASKRAHDRPGLLRVRGLWLLEDPNPEQGGKDHRNKPGCDQSDGNDGED